MQTIVMQNQLIKRILEELSNYEVPEDIVAIYLYGSILRGKLRVDSDIDIAFLPHFKVDEFRALELISLIESIFTKIFKKIGFLHQISVLNMRGKYVSIELLFNIIRNGVCLYEKSKDEHFEFKNFVMREYLDFKVFLDELREKRYDLVLKKD